MNENGFSLDDMQLINEITKNITKTFKTLERSRKDKLSLLHLKIKQSMLIPIIQPTPTQKLSPVAMRLAQAVEGMTKTTVVHPNKIQSRFGGSNENDVYNLSGDEFSE